MAHLNRVAQLAQSTTVEGKLSLEDLLSTVINRDEVEKWIKQPVMIARVPSSHFHSLARVVVLLDQLASIVLLSSFNHIGELTMFVVFIKI